MELSFNNITQLFEKALEILNEGEKYKKYDRWLKIPDNQLSKQTNNQNNEYRSFIEAIHSKAAGLERYLVSKVVELFQKSEINEKCIIISNYPTGYIPDTNIHNEIILDLFIMNKEDDKIGIEVKTATTLNGLFFGYQSGSLDLLAINNDHEHNKNRYIAIRKLLDIKHGEGKQAIKDGILVDIYRISALIEYQIITYGYAAGLLVSDSENHKEDVDNLIKENENIKKEVIEWLRLDKNKFELHIKNGTQLKYSLVIAELKK